MQQPLISAIILNTKASRDTIVCVQGLLAQTVVQDMEILIVENHSCDESSTLLRSTFAQEPRVRLLEASKNRGFGKGYDIGIRQARGEYILINNPVKRLSADGIERMMLLMEADPTLGIIGPKLTHADGSARLSPRAFPRPLDVIAKRTVLGRWMPKRLDRYLERTESLDQERDVDWLGGGCILIRRAALEQVGSFDPRFFLFFEDIDLCRRFWLGGWRVRYVPSIIATDRKKRFSEMSALRMPFSKIGRAHIASALRYFAKWRGQTPPMHVLGQDSQAAIDLS